LLCFNNEVKYKFPKNVLGGVGGSLRLTVPSMNRLNQTEPATFQFCRVGLSLGILFSLF
jgi:hypothetical protein